MAGAMKKDKYEKLYRKRIKEYEACVKILTEQKGSRLKKKTISQ